MPAKVWAHEEWISETNSALLKCVMDDMLRKSGFNVLDFIEHHFNPQGYTALWLLSESHLAIHTFPEHNKTYLQISSCMLPYFQTFISLLNNTVFTEFESNTLTQAHSASEIP